ncbi:MAG: metallophosphoesterase [Alphaproteobacteria bacterium]
MTNRDQNAAQPQTAWFTRRRALETSPRKVSPDGPVGHRWWRGLELSFSQFENFLHLFGLYSRGRANALDISIKALSLTLPSLPKAFDGYRILQISDPHLDLLPELADRIVPLVRAASSDLLLLTGDYRDRHQDPPETGLALLAPILAAADAPDGRYALLGNHDPAAAVPILEGLGLTGLDDVHSFYTQAARDALLEPHEGCRIVAVHSAEIADIAAAAGFELYLCSHTHGGQICLPGGRPVMSHLRRCRAYNRGLWRHGGMIGYTSLGAGVASMPIRFNCPPEIVLITLRAPKITRG